MNIAYYLTQENYISALVSFVSVIINNTNSNIKFYFIIDNRFDNKKLEYFFKYIKNYKNITIETIPQFSYKKYPKVKDHILFSCFQLGNLIKENKILFMNAYSLVNGNLSELYNTDVSNNTCAAVEYIYSDTISVNFNINVEVIYNNQMLLINLDKWRNNDIYKKAIDFINDNTNSIFSEGERIVACFNVIINDCKLLDFKFNYTQAWMGDIPLTCNSINKIKYLQFLTHTTQPIIITAIGLVANTNYFSNTNYASLWWKYAEQTPIYNEIKEFKNSNKYKLSATSAQNSFKYTWLLSRIFPYIKPYIPRILIGFAIAIPLGLLDGVTALALKPYMDYVVGGKALEFSILSHPISISSLTMAFILPIGVILFAVFQGVLKYFNDYISAWTSQRITNDVKFDLFHRLIHMHPQFYDDNSSGIVISRYMGDPGTASAGIVDQIKTITTSLCGALGLIAVMIYSSWKLAFIGVLVLCIAFIPVALIRKRIKETSNKNMVIGGNITTNINETYSGNKVMAAYDLQDRQENYFKTQVWKSFNINMSLTKRAAWMSPLMYLIASFGIAIVLGYGTYLINTGHMTPGSFASFVTSLLLLYKPVKTLGGTLTGIQNIFVAMGRVFELFDLDSAIKDPENPLEMKGLNSLIEFKNVCFEYVPGQPVLKNINLKVDKNETIAIVGNSGGGKSTLVNLIPRFYDIKSGSIEFDGTDIRKFSLKSLRHNISMVFQDNFLFSGTIKENIMMGNPDATVDELMEAIKSAHLQDMIAELPEGLETELGERGLTLSGGQRQRVAIARAMLRNAPIVILDEATSALDNESEAIVQKAMDNLMQNKTVFIIAHRLSTIKNADRIAVINEGELVELGTHEELMQIENGQYKHLYEMQFKREVKVG